MTPDERDRLAKLEQIVLVQSVRLDELKQAEWERAAA